MKQKLGKYQYDIIIINYSTSFAWNFPFTRYSSCARSHNPGVRWMGLLQNYLKCSTMTLKSIFTEASAHFIVPLYQNFVKSTIHYKLLPHVKWFFTKYKAIYRNTTFIKCTFIHNFWSRSSVTIAWLEFHTATCNSSSISLQNKAIAYALITCTFSVRRYE